MPSMMSTPMTSQSWSVSRARCVMCLRRSRTVRDPKSTTVSRLSFGTYFSMQRAIAWYADGCKAGPPSGAAASPVGADAIGVETVAVETLGDDTVGAEE